LYKPVCDFGQSNYPESALNKEYNYVNDPHLLKYYQKRPQCVKLLQKLGKVDENGEIICTLKEYNNYRAYLQRLSVECMNKGYREEVNKRLYVDYMTKLWMRGQVQERRYVESIQRRINLSRMNEHLERQRIKNDKKIADKYKCDRLKYLMHRREHERALERRERKRKAKKMQQEITKMRIDQYQQKVRETLVKAKNEQLELAAMKKLNLQEDALKRKKHKQKFMFELKEKFHEAKICEILNTTEENNANKKSRIEWWKGFYNKMLRIDEQKLRHLYLSNRHRQRMIDQRISQSLLMRGCRGFNFRIKDEDKLLSVKVKELMVEHAERFKHLSREQMANEIYNMLEENKDLNLAVRKQARNHTLETSDITYNVMLQCKRLLYEEKYANITSIITLRMNEICQYITFKFELARKSSSKNNLSKLVPTFKKTYEEEKDTGISDAELKDIKSTVEEILRSLVGELLLQLVDSIDEVYNQNSKSQRNLNLRASGSVGDFFSLDDKLIKLKPKLTHTINLTLKSILSGDFDPSAKRYSEGIRQVESPALSMLAMNILDEVLQASEEEEDDQDLRPSFKDTKKEKAKKKKKRKQEVSLTNLISTANESTIKFYDSDDEENVKEAASKAIILLATDKQSVITFETTEKRKHGSVMGMENKSNYKTSVNHLASTITTEVLESIDRKRSLTYLDLEDGEIKASIDIIAEEIMDQVIAIDSRLYEFAAIASESEINMAVQEKDTVISNFIYKLAENLVIKVLNEIVDKKFQNAKDKSEITNQALIKLADQLTKNRKTRDSKFMKNKSKLNQAGDVAIFFITKLLADIVLNVALHVSKFEKANGRMMATNHPDIKESMSNNFAKIQEGSSNTLQRAIYLLSSHTGLNKIDEVNTDQPEIISEEVEEDEKESDLKKMINIITKGVVDSATIKVSSKGKEKSKKRRDDTREKNRVRTRKLKSEKHKKVKVFKEISPSISSVSSDSSDDCCKLGDLVDLDFENDCIQEKIHFGISNAIENITENIKKKSKTVFEGVKLKEVQAEFNKDPIKTIVRLRNDRLESEKNQPKSSKKVSRPLASLSSLLQKSLSLISNDLVDQCISASRLTNPLELETLLYFAVSYLMSEVMTILIIDRVFKTFKSSKIEKERLSRHIYALVGGLLNTRMIPYGWPKIKPCLPKIGDIEGFHEIRKKKQLNKKGKHAPEGPNVYGKTKEDNFATIKTKIICGFEPGSMRSFIDRKSVGLPEQTYNSTNFNWKSKLIEDVIKSKEYKQSFMFVSDDEDGGDSVEEDEHHMIMEEPSIDFSDEESFDSQDVDDMSDALDDMGEAIVDEVLNSTIGAYKEDVNENIELDATKESQTTEEVLTRVMKQVNSKLRLISQRIAKERELELQQKMEKEIMDELEVTVENEECFEEISESESEFEEETVDDSSAAINDENMRPCKDDITKMCHEEDEETIDESETENEDTEMTVDDETSKNIEAEVNEEAEKKKKKKGKKGKKGKKRKGSKKKGKKDKKGKKEKKAKKGGNQTDNELNEKGKKNKKKNKKGKLKVKSQKSLSQVKVTGDKKLNDNKAASKSTANQSVSGKLADGEDVVDEIVSGAITAALISTAKLSSSHELPTFGRVIVDQVIDDQILDQQTVNGSNQNHKVADSEATNVQDSEEQILAELKLNYSNNGNTDNDQNNYDQSIKHQVVKSQISDEKNVEGQAAEIFTDDKPTEDEIDKIGEETQKLIDNLTQKSEQNAVSGVVDDVLADALFDTINSLNQESSSDGLEPSTRVSTFNVTHKDSTNIRVIKNQQLKSKTEDVVSLKKSLTDLSSHRSNLSSRSVSQTTSYDSTSQSSFDDSVSSENSDATLSSIRYLSSSNATLPKSSDHLQASRSFSESSTIQDSISSGSLDYSSYESSVDQSDDDTTVATNSQNEQRLSPTAPQTPKPERLSSKTRKFKKSSLQK